MNKNLSINGYPDNGYILNDSVIINEEVSQGARALVDIDTLWKQGSSGIINLSIDQTGNLGTWCYPGALANINNYRDSNIVTMQYSFLDPPVTSFNWNGINYDVSLFRDNNGINHRNGCYNINDCDPNFKPGSTILHEFMHLMGGSHEHQNTLNNPLVFDIGNVYALYCDGDCEGPTRNPDSNESCKQRADFNILNNYTCYDSITGNQDKECYSYSSYDIDSILLYPLYDCTLKEGSINLTKFNYRLSYLDKEWLRNKYPLISDIKPKIVINFVNGKEWQKAFIEKTITEHLSPYVGVIFEWKNGSKNNSVITDNSTTDVETEVETEVETDVETTKAIITTVKNDNQFPIWAIVIIIVVVVFIILFLVFLYKLYQSKQ